MCDERIAYFGYGSLVNLDTLQPGYLSAHPARLKGWERHWQSRPEISHGKASSSEQSAWRARLAQAGVAGTPTMRDIALLSVRRREGVAIAGMLVIDRLSALPALDDRERLYDRVKIAPGDVELAGAGNVLEGIRPENIFLYVGQSSAAARPMLLQSYLDAVMAGFLKAHGEDGLADFIATTFDFDRKIIEDRHSPLYPRAVQLDSSLCARFDEMLVAAGVQYASHR